MNRIKEARLKKNLTQKQLSERSGLSQAYINELENRKKVNPSIIVLDKLAASLEVPLSEILEEEGGSIAEIARNIDKW
jgi:transcriptional regulator with XRE-family HTH domain